MPTTNSDIEDFLESDLIEDIWEEDDLTSYKLENLKKEHRHIRTQINEEGKTFDKQYPNYEAIPITNREGIYIYIYISLTGNPKILKPVKSRIKNTCVLKVIFFFTTFRVQLFTLFK